MKLIEVWKGQIYQRGEFRKLPLAVKRARLIEAGIIAVLNVSPRCDGELSQAMGGATGFYLHAPIPDSPNADFGIVEEAAMWGLRSLEYGKLLAGNAGGVGSQALLVHCHAGRNRSSLLSAILLMELHGLTGVEAVAHMRRVRPNALATSAFVDYLEQRPSDLLTGART